jgi:hypothetical protein
MAGDATAGPYVAPDDYAIVVGINRYRTGIDALQGAVNDATLFHEWAIDPDGGGLDPTHAKLIVSPSQGPYDPSREDIETEIMGFYERANETGRRIGRRLYLFMAGHGVAPPDGNDCSLIAANSFANPYWALQGVLTADRVRKQPFFVEVVLFMACCRDVDGSAPSYSGLPGAGQPLPNSNYLHGMAVKWAKRAIEKELPHPFYPAKPSLWQSVFSHALLKGLRSAVDDEGRVTSLSLKNFVRKQVQALLPPDDNRPPDFFLDDSNPPIVFRDVAHTQATAPDPNGPPAAITSGRAAPAPNGPGDPTPGSGAPGARMGGVVTPGRTRRGISSEGASAESPPRTADATLAGSGLTPVEIILPDAATTFEVLDGDGLAKLDPPMERTATGTFKVYLKPSLYVFRVPGRQPIPARVLGEAFSVTI